MTTETKLGVFLWNVWKFIFFIAAVKCLIESIIELF